MYLDTEAIVDISVSIPPQMDLNLSDQYDMTEVWTFIKYSHFSESPIFRGSKLTGHVTDKPFHGQVWSLLLYEN